MNRCSIHYINDELAQDLNHQDIQTVVNAILENENLNDQQLHIMLVDSEESARLHQEHFNVPDATDVMSFPDGSIDEESQLTHLGDLAVCVDVAKKIATQRDKPYTHELILYVIHGLLHLLGYDDQHEDDRQEMWDLQRKYLALLNIPLEDKPI